MYITHKYKYCLPIPDRTAATTPAVAVPTFLDAVIKGGRRWLFFDAFTREAATSYAVTKQMYLMPELYDFFCFQAKHLSTSITYEY